MILHFHGHRKERDWMGWSATPTFFALCPSAAKTAISVWFYHVRPTAHQVLQLALTLGLCNRVINHFLNWLARYINNIQTTAVWPPLKSSAGRTRRRLSRDDKPNIIIIQLGRIPPQTILSWNIRNWPQERLLRPVGLRRRTYFVHHLKNSLVDNNCWFYANNAIDQLGDSGNKK